jgi:hypothetical protein
VSNIDNVLDFLIKEDKKWCDDCLSKILFITPRQQVNQICNRLKNTGLVKRYGNECSNCKKVKMINSATNNDNIRHSDQINTNKIIRRVEENNYKSIVNDFNLENAIKVNIEFFENNIKNRFVFYKQHKLREIIEKDKYLHMKNCILENFKSYLDYDLGAFLIEMKTKENSIYKSFINKYGDLDYCRFKIINKELSTQKGIYFYEINDKIVYIGRCLDSYEKRINAGYGSISPKNCYLDGRSTNCRINNLININIEEIHLYILPLINNEDIKNIEINLINKYKPCWNIQGI